MAALEHLRPGAWNSPLVAAGDRRRPSPPAPHPLSLESVILVDSLGGRTDVDIAAATDLDRAVRALSGRQRLAVELYYFVGLPIKECAEAMNCSQGTVKSTLSDARSRLAPMLEVNI